jgi:glycosyltransferase involved in cell wall biosynthesis
MKIVYVIDSLASKGGAERILSDKMNYMVNNYGYEVWVVTCYQNPDNQPNAYYLSEQIHQVNLNIPYYSQYSHHYPMRLLYKWTLYHRLQRELNRTIQCVDPDILIGLGYFQADVVCSVKCRAAKVIESHEARIFTMSDQGLSRSWLSRVFMRYYKKRYFHRVELLADVVVTLTTGDAKEWKSARRVEIIPNFSVIPISKVSTCMSKRVISVGRLEWQKGFDRLIDAWSCISTKYPEWRLDIFGSGTLEETLRRQITRMGLNTVTIHPFTSSISVEYASSSIFALSSRFEGFALVLLEAMQHGLPCVSYDCPFGPSDVLVDGECGFVVPNGDMDQFVQQLELLMSDDTLRQKFSQKAVVRAGQFGVDNIMQQWKSLFEQLCQ